MSSRYHQAIDPDLPNNTHALLVTLVGSDQRVLELGAASGYMTEYLQGSGCSVTAAEFDPAATEMLNQIADRAVIGDLNDPATLDAVEGPFDVVLAGDVFEHLLDPGAVLRAAVDKLAPDGRVVLSVPNVTQADVVLSLLLGRFDYHPWGLLDETHIRFFTYDTLLAFVRNAGLVPQRLERIRSGPFETELGVDRRSVSDLALAEVLRQPEALTYQFVLSAIRDDGDPDQRARLEAEFQSTGGGAPPRPAGGPTAADQLAALRSDLQTVDAEREAARARTRDLEAELAAALAARETLEAQVRAEHSGRAYRALQRYRRAVESLAPQGTRRRSALTRLSRAGG